jgi:hypothetical protein
MAVTHEQTRGADNAGRFRAGRNGHNRAVGRERRSGRGQSRGNGSNALREAYSASLAVEVGVSQDADRNAWPFGPCIGRAFAAARLFGAELARFSFVPSPARHRPTPGLHLRSCRCCRKPFDSTETIAFAPMLTFKGTNRIVPVCLRCLPKSWRRRCTERHCERCSRRMLVFDQPEYKPRRFCLNVCHVAAYYAKHRNEITARERRKIALYGRPGSKRWHMMRGTLEGANA